MSFLKHFIIFSLLVLLITLLDFFYLGKISIGIDDANIFFTYAQHISKGEGFVYNTGGEKVEGFTSLLWVLVCALFYCIASHPEILIIIFSFVITSFSVTLIYREVRNGIAILEQNFLKKYFLWIYSAFIICIGSSFIAWSVLSLMENALWNLLFISMIVLILKDYQQVNTTTRTKITLLVSAICLVLTRPEGLAWGIVFSVLLAWTRLKNKKSLAFPVLFFAVFACTSAALIYFRLKYFGYPFPNTYYAKVSNDKVYNVIEGVKYAISFLAGYNAVLTILFVILLIFSVSKITERKRLDQLTYSASTNKVLNKIVIVSIIILLSISLPLTTGGDHFGGYRFYQGILLLFAWGIPAFGWLYNEGVTNTRAMKFSIPVIFFSLTIIGAGTFFDLKTPAKTQLNYEFQLAIEGRVLAETLNDFLNEPKPSVGIIAAGGFGLKYEGKTVDLMGLNNTLMAHSAGNRIGIKNHAAFNKDVFYLLKAQLILPKIVADEKEARIQYMNLQSSSNFENLAMKNIFNDAYFQQRYQPAMISKKDRTEKIFILGEVSFLKEMQSDSSVNITKINR